jgi:hypothetical protein
MAKRARGEEEGKEWDGERKAVRPSSEGSGGSKQLKTSHSKYNYAVVCSSNINRSMEAHVAFFNQRLRVASYGAGR